MTDQVLAVLGLARRSGALAMGEAPVAEACRSGKARAVLLAADAADNTADRAARLAGERIPLAALPRDKGQVGFALGRSSCAVLAVTDPGLAALVLAKLAAEDEVRYGQTAALLEQRAQQARRRARRKPGTRGAAKAGPGKRAKHGSAN